MRSEPQIDRRRIAAVINTIEQMIAERKLDGVLRESIRTVAELNHILHAED